MLGSLAWKVEESSTPTNLALLSLMHGFKFAVSEATYCGHEHDKDYQHQAVKVLNHSESAVKLKPRPNQPDLT